MKKDLAFLQPARPKIPTNKNELIEFLKFYGFIVLRLNGKIPIDDGWNKLNQTLNREFSHNHNIGILTGVEFKKTGFLTGLDFDMSRDDYQANLLCNYIVAELENRIGSFFKVLTGGKHLGMHGYAFLTVPIYEIIKIPIIFSKDRKFAIEIFCRGKNEIGRNIVGPFSVDVEEYLPHESTPLAKFGDYFKPTKTEELLSFFSEDHFKITIAIAQLCTHIEHGYTLGLIDGYSIDLALADYLINELKLYDDSLYTLAFHLVFKNKFNAELTNKFLARIANRDNDEFENVTMGSIYSKFKGSNLYEDFKNSLINLEKLCIKKKATLSSTPSSHLAKVDSPTSQATIPNEVEDMFFSCSGQDTEDLPMLIEEILPAKKFCLLHGPPGEGKTTASMLLADMVIRAHGNYIVYFSFEQKAGDIEEKLTSIGVPKNQVILASPKEEFILSEKKHQTKMFDYLKKCIEQKGRIDLIIVDSLMAITAGNLNDGAAGAAALFFNKVCSELDVTIILIHHNNKNGESGRERIFGSSLLSGAVVLAFEIEPIEKIEFARKLIVSKSNMLQFPPNLEIIIGQYPGKPAYAYRIESSQSTDKKGSSLVDQCRDILFEKLKNGDKIDSDIARQGLDNMSESTITRASQQIGIEKIHENGKKVWFIPKDHIMLKLYNRK